MLPSWVNRRMPPLRALRYGGSLLLVAGLIGIGLWHFLGYGYVIRSVTLALTEPPSRWLVRHPNVLLWGYYVSWAGSPFCIGFCLFWPLLRSWPVRLLTAVLSVCVAVFLFALYLPGTSELLLESIDVLPLQHRRHAPYEDFAAGERAFSIAAAAIALLMVAFQRLLRRVAA